MRIGTELSGQSLAVSVKAKGKTDKKIKAIKENTDAQMKQKKVKELLKQSRPITGTLAETYLRKHRRIPGDLPSTLRFHRALFHPFLKESYPALLVPATDFLRNTQGVQAIFLNPKTGQKLSQLPSKISMGNIKGQHAKVTHSQEGKVAIAEGPETALSIAKASPHWQVYCVFGAFNFEHFKVKALEKKDGVPKEIVLCADNDGMNPGVIKSLTRAAFSFQQAGFSTTMTMPKEKGYDFNDILKKEGVEAVSQVLNQEVKVPPLTLLSEPQRLQVMQKLIQSLSPDEGKERAADNLKPPRIEAVLGNKPAEKTDSFREESQRVSRIISGKTGLEKTSNLPQKIHEDREREL
ncbi:MAG: hypothetical protein K0R12_1260 [Gammaproteobacteria bacterium]|nr:hypothetical protein [Gammaproteobacteria bacterium]